MFQSYHPVQLNKQLLDDLLAKGWFRGGNVMYQSKMLCLEDAVYSVVNIRSNLENYQFSKSLRKLMAKNKKHFTYSIQPLRITSEKDALYKQQSKKFKGFVHDNLENYLFEGLPYSNFTTYDLSVFDGDKLVACSFFDLGEKSMASLLGAYDEDYKRFSLGIFTMLLEVEFALEKGFQFYYPGYVFRNNDLFDYKLRVGQIEYYDWNDEWRKLEDIENSKFPADQLNSAYSKVEDSLLNAGIKTRRYLYPFFSLGYSQQFDLRFLHSIQFIQLNRMDIYGNMHVLVYDFQEDYYSILEVQDQNELNLLNNSNFSKDIQESNAYFQRLLSVEQIVYGSHNSEEIVAFLASSELIK